MPVKTSVVTGASSGIGDALAVELAAAGFDLVLVGRDEARLADVAARSRARGGSDRRVTTLRADLSTIAGARDLAARLLEAAPRLDVLVHNAGVLPTARRLTSDGFEESFATNHLAPFVINEALRARLVESAPSRVVQVSAGLYIKGRVDLEKGPYGLPFGPFGTYGSSKLWNLLATLELARELEGEGVTVNAVHPGVVRTRLGDATGLLGLVVRIAKRFWATPEEGARGPLHLATDPALASTTGRYFDQLRAIDLHPVATQAGLGREVVARTRELVRGR
jgi:NAD(P)-dependent dehydrogenase (short-subunit alcohol dehydrogenase family)